MKKSVKQKLKMLATIVLLLVVAFIAWVTLNIIFHPAFGAKPDPNSLAGAGNLQDGRFVNTSEFIAPSKDINNYENLVGTFPAIKIPSVKLDLSRFEGTAEQPIFAWFGHSTILMKAQDTTVIVDPIFSKRASPSQIIGPKKFDFEVDFSVDDLPPIDLVLITHDHYDHLDYYTIRDLKYRVEKFYVPLGVDAHLKRWGVDEAKIETFAWHDRATFDDLEFIYAPTHHFSGRFVTTFRTTLWGSWIVRSGEHQIYFNGDSGYSDEFAEIQKRYGNFDFAFLECGAYNPQWATMHMFPEQTAMAADDLKADKFFAIHNGKFSLARHDWKDPLRRVFKANEGNVSELVTAVPGEVFALDEGREAKQWWERE